MPGSAGIGSATLSGRAPVSAWTKISDWFSQTGRAASGYSKSVLLSMIDMLPIKQPSPLSTALLKHYAERTGDAYTLKAIPQEWRDWVVKATKGRSGHHKALDPYNSGLYDLRNSLGHFDVDVKINPDGSKTYVISDVYQFGFKKGDAAQRGRHGFPLGSLSGWEVAALRQLLPDDEYMNPGGFKERWEVRTVGKETILFVPQQYLAQQGTPFQVSGSFTVDDKKAPGPVRLP